MMGATTKAEAKRQATAAADAYELPQTVYKARDCADWAHISALADRVQPHARAQLAVTILPRTYWRR
jgi:hypothetical protein